MTEQKKDFPDFYITAASACPYLPDRVERKLFTHLTHDKSPERMDQLLTGGFRRSQNIAYLPYCEGCRACVSVRIRVDDFKRTKSLKRLWKRNNDIVAERIEAVASADQYDLFRSYILSRHGDGGMADMSVHDYNMMIEDSVIDSYLTEYRIKPSDPLSLGEEGQLAAVALCDLLSDGISLVYSFFDPSLGARSLGSYMILDHVEQARRLGRPYVYLGYWIKGCRKMSYKTRFGPIEALCPDGWKLLDDEN